MRLRYPMLINNERGPVAIQVRGSGAREADDKGKSMIEIPAVEFVGTERS